MTQFLLILASVIAVFAIRQILHASARRRSMQLVDESIETGDFIFLGEEDEGRLQVWLARAGYRDPGAVSQFWGATAGCVAFALMLILTASRFGLQEAMIQSLASLPGNVTDLLLVVGKGAAVIIVVIFACIPLMVVRAARRKRIESIEQDLAPTLELFATLAEAGLGFDAALSRILDSEAADRALGQEFEIYQRDKLGGISRRDSLGRLAQRIDIVAVSIFVSAMLQAEQVGASLSETLRVQTDDLRDRRKMQAVLQAQALPVKLVFPLMFCFLPSLFYSTLGPVIAQFIEIADSVIRR